MNDIDFAESYRRLLLIRASGALDEPDKGERLERLYDYLDELVELYRPSEEPGATAFAMLEDLADATARLRERER